jgi:predicted GNAT family acetyltransferase
MTTENLTMALEFTLHPDAAQFLGVAEPYLLRNEAENSLTLGVAATLASRSSSDHLWVTVAEEGEVIGTAFHTPPYNVVLTGTSDEAVDLMARRIHEAGTTPPGVLGPSRLASRFSKNWAEITGGTIGRGLAQRIYQLDKVMPPASTAGELRQAESGDLDLLASWLDSFIEETGIPNPLTGRQMASSGIDEKRIFVWDNGGPVSTALWNRPTKNGVGINAVYTPGNERSRGYASAVVAALSQRMLDQGHAFCSLYTDLSNRTANDIYMSIGYKPVCDVDEYLFRWRTSSLSLLPDPAPCLETSPLRSVW